MFKFYSSIVVFVLLLPVCWWLNGFNIIGIWSIGLGCLYASFLGLAAMNIQWNVFVTGIHSNTNDSIVLSFDDGPHPIYTPQILKVLKEENVQAMFFVIGKQVEKHPDILKQIHSEGHQIALHTQNHPWFFGFLSAKQVQQEIASCSKAIQKVIGVSPVYFRPPFGVTNPNVFKGVKAENVQLVGWNLRSFDTHSSFQDKWPTFLAKKLHKGAIILLHDRIASTANQLSQFIRTAKQNGFTFGPLSDEKL